MNAQAAPLRPHDPRRIGAYELVGRLGEGGQGAVYLGRDPHGRPVAVKLLHARFSGDPRARHRFVRELQVAQRVSGFCTAQVLAADVAGEVPYFVSEYVPGPSLRELVAREGPLEASSLMRLAIGTATALAAIHRAGVVHRDFKPGNVLMGPDGPRVIDFGVARALGAEALTATGGTIGTPAFMAPEQISGRAGPEADVFAWAGTILFAATGRPPFGGDSVPAVMHRILHARPDLSPLPSSLAGIVGACLAKDPAARPTADAVLQHLLGEVGAAPRTGPPALAEAAALAETAPPRPARRRRRTLPLLAAAVTAVLVGVPGIVLMRDVRPGTAQPRTVTLAFLGALSGPSADVGRAMREGARLAIEEHNAADPDIRIRLVDHDTQGSAAQADRLVEDILGSDAAAVIGPTLPHEVDEVGVGLDQRIPTVAPGAGTTETPSAGGRFHRVVASEEVAVQALVDFMARAEAPAHVAVIGSGESEVRDLADAAAGTLRDRGVKVTERNLPPPDADEEGIDETAERIARDDPDAVLFLGPPDVGVRLLERFRAHGSKARFHVGEWALRGEPPPEGTVAYCGCLDPARADARFRQRFQARFGHPPSWYAVEGYNAALPLVSAVKAGRTTREQIGRHLDSVDVPGLGQRLRFAPGGRLTAPNVYVYQVRQGRMTLLGTTATARL